jgi:hypothetical protein
VGFMPGLQRGFRGLISEEFARPAVKAA